ncbi:hypothetical protein ACIOGX_12485 [Streptomyces sp. NPDC088147]|uniref:hypothetical protein n=1 Tax=Streptomyces sp. NPDC088147 TaxID=3365830 RepID=UPI0037F9C98B
MTGATGGGSLQRVVTRAQLRSRHETVVFQFNPTEISISHNAEGLADPIGPQDKEDARAFVHSIATRGSTRLVVSSLVFTGERCQTIVATLMDWVAERPPPGGKGKGRREPLRFEWGAADRGFDYSVELMRFDCTYTRFSRGGRPIRAELRNLTLHVLGHGAGDAAERGGHVNPAIGAQRGNRRPAGLPDDAALGPHTDPGRAWVKGRF